MTPALLDRIRDRWASLVRRTTERDAQAPVTVLLTVRTTSRDHADLRVLLDATVTRSEGGDDRDVRDLERVTHALVEPAVERWVRRTPLAGLGGDPAEARYLVEEAVRPEMAALGVELLRVDVVAVEHLLLSPSASPDRQRG